MKYILNKYHFNIPDKVLLDDLRGTAKKLGKHSISAMEYDFEGTFNSKTVRTRFGGWNSALVKAGLEINKYRCISEALLFSNMKRVWDKLKRQPLAKDMARPLSACSDTTYVKKFGSWRRALEAFVRSGPGRYPPLTKTSAARTKNKPKRHPAKDGTGKKRRKAKMQHNITKSMRFDILKRDNYKCRLCGASPAISRGVTLHIDHIIPRIKNGETIPSNLQTLCSDCNYGKGDR